MTRSVHAEITIAAPPERVWGILTDFAALPRWNPFVRQASGEVREGAQLSIGLRLFRGPLTSFKPTVTRVEPNRELRWLAHLLTPGLLDTVRIFRIVPQNEGAVRFIQHEDCTGVLAAPLFALGLGGRIRRGYLAMNRALKTQAERPPSG